MFKRLRGLLLAGIMLFSTAGAVACNRDSGEDGGNGGNVPTETLPDYSADVDTKAVRFAGLCEPGAAGYYVLTDSSGRVTYSNESYITVEKYEEIKECGIDIMLAHPAKSKEVASTILDVAALAGVDYIIQIPELFTAAQGGTRAMREWLGNLGEKESFYGVLAADEPGIARFEELGAAYDVFKQVSDGIFWVNLLPCYGMSNMTFPEYVEAYCEQVGTDYISADFYPYDDDTMNLTMKNTFLYHLEVMERAAVKYGVEHWEFLQGNKAFTGSKIPDYYDLRHQVYTSMCFGVELFEYYCYATPAEFRNDEINRCLLDFYGNKTDIYEAAKKINFEIKDFDHVYMNFVDDWKGVMTFVGSNNTRGRRNDFDLLQDPMESHERIASVESEEDLVCGVYKNDDNYDAFMFVNYEVPGLRKESKVTVTFNGATKAVCYIGGKEVVKDLNNGKLELTLGAGEGVFVIPVNA